MAKLVDTEILAYFKAKMDAAIAKTFMKRNDYVDDETNLIKFDTIQGTEPFDEIVKMHIDATGGSVKYFVDVDGVKGTAEVVGEVGVLYLDVESEDYYKFDGTNFVPYESNIATTADIDKLFSQGE